MSGRLEKRDLRWAIGSECPIRMGVSMIILKEFRGGCESIAITTKDINIGRLHRAHDR